MSQLGSSQTMENIYANMDYEKTVMERPAVGPRSSQMRFYRAAVLSLGLLSGLLMVGIITLGVFYRASVHNSSVGLCTSCSGLKELLQTQEDQLSSLNNSLSETTKELERLRTLSKQEKTCPSGWKKLCSSCYFFSTSKASWNQGRQDCRDRGADLVVIESLEEQEFLSQKIKDNTWIGLSDRDNEGTWKWVNGTLLTQAYWNNRQPDNGGGDPQWGEEDCVHIRPDTRLWNDLNCDVSFFWICEK